MREIWKDIPKYKSLYQVSNFGNVKGLKRNKLMTPFTTKLGYKFLCLTKNGKQKRFAVHRLVLQGFIGISNKEANHLDGNKGNNRLENLEYCSRLQNVRHAFRTGLVKSLYGENHPNAKLTNKKVRGIRMLLKEGMSQREIAEMYQVSQKLILDIKKLRIWSHV